MRRAAWIVVVLIACGSCTADDEPVARDDPPADRSAPAESPSSPEGAALIDDFPIGSCSRFGPVPPKGQVTFAHGSHLFAAKSDGSGLRCIGRYLEGQKAQWGGLGDRLFLETSAGGEVIFSKNAYDLPPSDTHPYWQGLSRPTGTSALYVGGDRRHLYKVSANGKEQEDISFLRRHDEVLYHPAGMHIIAAGVGRDGTYGIWVATNEGKEARLLVLSEDAKRVYSLSFSVTGELFYAAEHADHYDVHSVSLDGAAGEVSAEGGLATYYTSKFPITSAVVSQFRRSPIAVQVGTTDGDSCPSETIVVRGKEEIALEADGPTAPVGWLPNGDLVYVSMGRDCDTNRLLHVWDRAESRILVSAPGAVAVRGTLPDPPDPPTKEPEVVA